MYESTPQHIIDEELAPGPVAAWMDSSSSSDTSSSDDSDDSRDSHTTAGRIKRVMRGGRRRRKSSATSKESPELPEKPTRTPSYSTQNGSIEHPEAAGPSISPISPIGHRFGAVDLGEEADEDVAVHHRSRTHSFTEYEGKSKKSRKQKKKHHKKKKNIANHVDEAVVEEVTNEKLPDDYEPRRVDFAVSDIEAQAVDQVQKKAFTLRGIRPAIPKTFSQTVFSQPAPSASPHLGLSTPIVTGPIPRVRYGIRRTNSLPDRLNQVATNTQPGVPPPIRQASSLPAPAVDEEEEEENISRTTAVILLLASTGLVATCAEFMVSSISDVTTNTALGETFVGLIILPIVGNAAEHVTAVTVASKNKMDLAIGVAVGSSIQIGEYNLFYQATKTNSRSSLRNSLRHSLRMVYEPAYVSILYPL